MTIWEYFTSSLSYLDISRLQILSNSFGLLLGQESLSANDTVNLSAERMQIGHGMNRHASDSTGLKGTAILLTLT